MSAFTVTEVRSTITDNLSNDKGGLKFIEFCVYLKGEFLTPMWMDDNRIYVSYYLSIYTAIFSSLYFIWRLSRELPYNENGYMKFIIWSAIFLSHIFCFLSLTQWIYVCRSLATSNKYILIRYIFLLSFALLFRLFHVLRFFHISRWIVLGLS